MLFELNEYTFRHHTVLTKLINISMSIRRMNEAIIKHPIYRSVGCINADIYHSMYTILEFKYDWASSQWPQHAPNALFV